MRIKAILISSVVLAIMTISNSVVFACGPVEFDAPADILWCDARAKLPTPPPTPAPAPVLVATKLTAPTIQKSGDSPENAMEVPEDFITINPDSHLWFKIGSDGSHIDVWMTTYAQPGIGFAVYAPNQEIFAPETRPKGVGTYSKADPNTLRWSGGSWTQIGVWYALVTNISDKPVSFQLNTNQSKVDHNCHSYFEDLPNGARNVYWTACN